MKAIKGLSGNILLITDNGDPIFLTTFNTILQGTDKTLIPIACLAADKHLELERGDWGGQ